MPEVVVETVLEFPFSVVVVVVSVVVVPSALVVVVVVVVVDLEVNPHAQRESAITRTIAVANNLFIFCCLSIVFRIWGSVHFLY